MDENLLIQNAQKGDVDAFNQLVINYQTRIYNLTYRIMGDEFAAEDATQNTFISAYHKIAAFRGGSFIAWLLRIATNQCYDTLRYAKRHATIPLEPDSDDDEPLESPAWIKDPAEGPEGSFDQAELEQAIQHCLNGLPLEYRAVAVMVDVQEMDYEVAAHIIKVPLGTIKSRLARARLRLRKCLLAVWELLPTTVRLKIEGNQS